MVKRLFSRLITTKKRRFEQNLDYEGRQGTILEVDPERQWFVALTDHKLEDFREFGAPMVILFQRRNSTSIARARLVIDPKKSELFIGDYESDIENRGYGSILLRNVIQLAKAVGVSRITGNLSAVDSDHFDKLEHLYYKYGFEVNILGKTGTILLELK